MEIVGVYYGRCDASNWKEAEEDAAELLEYMGFINIRHLSKKDAIFPFDFAATHIYEEKDYLIDVTLRTKKPVKTKRLNVWRSLGFETALLMLLPEKLMAVLIKLDPSDRWINLTQPKIRKLEKEWEDFLTQTKLTHGY